jgi:hypothetical protein
MSVVPYSVRRVAESRRYPILAFAELQQQLDTNQDSIGIVECFEPESLALI